MTLKYEEELDLAMNVGATPRFGIDLVPMAMSCLSWYQVPPPPGTGHRVRAAGGTRKA